MVFIGDKNTFVRGVIEISRKTTLYLDTSIPNALLHEPDDRKETTSLLFSQILPQYDVFISELTVAEIHATPDSSVRTKLVELINPFYVLPISPKAEALAEEYLKYLNIPEADALHIAIASVEGINYLITWNMRHIARERTRRIVDNTNFLFGAPRIYIVTPDDFLD